MFEKYRYIIKLYCKEFAIICLIKVIPVSGKKFCLILQEKFTSTKDIESSVKSLYVEELLSFTKSKVLVWLMEFQLFNTDFCTFHSGFFFFSDQCI